MADGKTQSMKEQVEQRVREEQKALAEAKIKLLSPTPETGFEISDSELVAYLQENRLSNAKLNARLHRGNVVLSKTGSGF